MHLSIDRSVLEDGTITIDTEEFELLFESYLQDAQGFCRTIKNLDCEIKNAEALLEIQLDTARNRLLTFGFLLNVITFAVTLATFIAGLFGMVNSMHRTDTMIE